MDERTTPLLALHAWGREVRFGNLIKPPNVNALYWYTVDLGRQDAEELYAFDAQGLNERASAGVRFDTDIEQSIRQACLLATSCFATYDEFHKWVKEHFYRIQPR